MANMITVTGKDDLGYSPKFGQIIKGQQYTINEEDFTPELFVKPGKTKGGTD